MTPSKIVISCKECHRRDYMHNFTDSCDKPNCKLIMARRKNNKPPAILSPVIRHHESCVCSRCLNEDATTLEAALLKAEQKQAEAKPAGKPHKPLKLYARTRSSMVLSEYNEEEPVMYVDVPDAIYTKIIPRKGK